MNLMSFQNPKVFVNRNKKQLSSFVINYRPSAIQLSIIASGQGQSRSNGLKLEKCLADRF